MADGDASRRAARLVCATGGALLVVGIGVALIDRRTAQDRRVEAQVTTIARELERDKRRAPRLEVAFAQLALKDLGRLKASGDDRGRAYDQVPTEVGVRIASQRPPLRPSYATARHPRSHDDFALAAREGRTRNGTMSLLALLVTTNRPASPVQLRLVVDRAEIDGYAGVYDAGELVTITDPIDVKIVGGRTEARLLKLANVRHRSADVRWTADAAHPAALVPLALMDEQLVPRRNLSEALKRTAYRFSHYSLVSGIALLPRRLYIARPGRPDLRVSIANATAQPIKLSPP